MGWKQIYVADQSFFKSLYEQSKAWGELQPIKFVDAKIVYGAGVHVSSGSSNGIKASPALQWSPLKTRIRGRFAIYVAQGASAKLTIWFAWKKNGDYCNIDGAPWWGCVFNVASGSGSLDIHTFEAIVEGTKVTIYIDGNKFLEKHLDAYPQHVVLGCSIDDASGEAAIAITEAIVEYYDWVEDIFVQTFQMMQLMMIIMLGVMVVVMIIKALKGKKRRGEEHGG